MNSTITLDDLRALFFCSSKPLGTKEIASFFYISQEQTLALLDEWSLTLEKDRVLELKQSALGWKLYLKKDYVPLAHRFWALKPQKLSKSALEILALIAFHQPLTRPEIEQLRGASLNPQHIRTLLDQEWIEIAGYKETPGRPALFRTTDYFLEVLGLHSLQQLQPGLEIEHSP